MVACVVSGYVVVAHKVHCTSIFTTGCSEDHKGSIVDSNTRPFPSRGEEVGDYSSRLLKYTHVKCSVGVSCAAQYSYCTATTYSQTYIKVK